MARIVYGVAGEGFGHSSRSHLIGQHLIDAGHEVLFVASRKSLAYLRTWFGPNVHEIAGLCLVYRNRRLSPARTAAANLWGLLKQRRTNRTLYRDVLGPFEPDLVISDFEPFSAWWAIRNGIPFISIDHQHLLSQCRIDRAAGPWTARLSADVVTRCHYTGAAAYIVLNFFAAPVKNANTILAPPVVRPQVAQTTAQRSDFSLVYTTDTSWKPKLLSTLAKFPGHTFFIYGLNESQHIGNCVLKKTSTTAFLRDLADCRGVIATAGFSLLSECLFLRKRTLLFPIEGQYEQMVNAHYVQKLGLGLFRRQLDAGVLAEHLAQVDQPMPDHPDVLWPDNDRFFKILSRTIHGVFSTFDKGALQEPTVDGMPALS